VLNLDATRYGTFPESGGGQEVARWSFSVGGAAGTIAETISAYDMAMSDRRYGPAKRYVSRERLEAMLKHEFAQLLESLNEKRGETKRFFAFANTVATRTIRQAGNGRGWLGIRFQTRPGEEPIRDHHSYSPPGLNCCAGAGSARDSWCEPRSRGILSL